jgi:hypothetical protein
VTLRTHALPERFGVVRFKLRAKFDQSMLDGSTLVLQLIREQLLTPYWGEKIVFERDRIISVELMFHGLSDEQAKAIWKPFADTIEAQPDQFEVLDPLVVGSIPSRDLWNLEVVNHYFHGALSIGQTSDGLNKQVFWTGDGSQAGLVWTAFDSLWLDRNLLDPDKVEDLARTCTDATKAHSFELHLNKGLAGASESTIAACNDTPVNPQSLTAFALLIVADGQIPAPGKELGGRLSTRQIYDGRSDRDRVKQVGKTFRQLVPDAGSYLNESDYFHPDIATAAWGVINCRRLQAVKNKFDPADLFQVHHGVRSTVG